MKSRAILNRDSGTLAGVDLKAFGQTLIDVFAANGNHVDVLPVSSDELFEELERAGRSEDCDAILCCGGDGTASATAGICYQHDKILGLIPGGTLNLYARTLGLPMDPGSAVEALGNAKVTPCDIALANGKPFIHQFSLGLQPEIIKRRDDFEYDSKAGKLLAGAKATMSLIAEEPKTYQLQLSCDGERQTKEVSFLTVTNNLYREDCLPFADRPDGGTLGMYWADPLPTYDMTMMITDILSGNWNENPHLSSRAANTVTLAFENDGELPISLDGELIEPVSSIEFQIRKKALRVLVPDSN